MKRAAFCGRTENTMGYDSGNYKRVRDAYTAKRKEAERLAEERKLQVQALSPAIAEIDRKLSGTGLLLFRIACEGGADLQAKIEEARKENQALLEAKGKLLASLGFPADYTEIRYECTACSDTGYLPNTKMCDCMKRALAAEGFRASGLGTLVDRQSFDNFSLDRFESEERELMKHNLDYMKHYADTFAVGAKSLLLIGGTGLGKTHLSTSLARTVIEKGYSVLYDTAHNVVFDFNYDQFKSKPEEELRSEKYLDCDLLLLDDLGTEVQTKHTNSYLYNLINTRMNRGKTTLISTNLTPNELLERYGDRLASRLFGEYEILLFRGKDIRLKNTF